MRITSSKFNFGMQSNLGLPYEWEDDIHKHVYFDSSCCGNENCLVKLAISFQKIKELPVDFLYN